MYNKIARINVYNRSEEEYRRIRAEITADIKTNNIKQYNSDSQRFEDYRGWGNYCLPNIPYAKAVEYAAKYDLDIDLIKHIIQPEDIKGLQVGDKVQYSTDSIFGPALSKGTVYEVNENSVTIRLYRSKTKGNVLRVGTAGMIHKGWDIYKDTYNELEVVTS